MEGYGVVCKQRLCLEREDTCLNLGGGGIEGIGQGASVVRGRVAPPPYPALTRDTNTQMSDLDCLSLF